MASTDFTVADVLAWARTKPAGERYNYMDNSNCALCQFLRETGRAKQPYVKGFTWVEDGGSSRYIPAPIQGPLCEGAFGRLADRLAKENPDAILTKSDWLQIDAYLTDIEQVSA